MKQVLAGLLALSLAGCALRIPLLVYSPGQEASGQTRPVSEVLDERALTPRYGTGAIVVVSEDKRRRAQRCMLEVALDDQPVAAMRPGEPLTVYAEPGRRIIDIGIREGASCTPASTRVAVEVVAHTTRALRVASGSHHGLKVEVDPYGPSLPR